MSAGTENVFGISSVAVTLNPLPKNEEHEPHDHRLAIGVIIAGIVFAVFMFLLLFVRYKVKVRSLRSRIGNLTASEVRDFFSGSTNPNQCQSTQNAFISCQPFNREFQIPMERLKIYTDKSLGSNTSTVLHEGVFKTPSLTGGKTECTRIVVKSPVPNVEVTTFKRLLMEVKIMGYLGKHENIVNLIGAVTDNIRKRELFVAVEHCGMGNLLAYIKTHRTDFKDLFQRVMSAEILCGRTSIVNFNYNQFEEAVAIPLQPVNTQNSNYENMQNAFSTMDLITWTTNISNGMKFLHAQNIVHGNLQAKNILLTHGKIAKISDYGLSAGYSSFFCTDVNGVPWRWMSIESLRDMQFSKKSDVWAFGVTMYELFSLGSLPYPGNVWTSEFVDQLVEGHRVSSPEFGNTEVYKLMMHCMAKDPNERMDFNQIIHKVQDIKAKLLASRAFARNN